VSAGAPREKRVHMPADVAPKPVLAARLRASNRRTALTLASIAMLFFFGIIASRFMGGVAGLGVVGAGALLYLAVAIGRNLRDTE